MEIKYFTGIYRSRKVVNSESSLIVFPGNSSICLAIANNPIEVTNLRVELIFFHSNTTLHGITEPHDVCKIPPVTQGTLWKSKIYHSDYQESVSKDKVNTFPIDGYMKMNY